MLVGLSYSRLYGQTVCGENQGPDSSCDKTCLLCDIDGLSRAVKKDELITWGKIGCSTGVGDAFAFVAMSNFLKVEVTISRCESVVGKTPIPAAFVIYEDFGTCADTIYGADLQPLTDCSGTGEIGDPQIISPNSSKVFTTNRNLVIGQIYYFEVGIVDSTDCDYSIKVLEGSTAVPQLTSFSLDNIYTPCQGETVDYTVLNPEPITDYIYTLNGDTISTEAFAQVTYDIPGTYELCIGGRNPCSEASPNCYTIIVDAPAITDTTLTICPSQCFTTPDTTFCGEGMYVLDLVDRNGCDSIVNLTLVNGLPDVTDLMATICSGDTLRYLDVRYFTSGTYSWVLPNGAGCDSLINLEILVAACPLEGKVYGTDVLCFDGNDGSIRFELSSGSPPYRYDFRRLGGGPAGNGSVALRNETTSLTGLPAGTYLIEVTDDFGSVGFFNTTIDRPEPVVVGLSALTYNGSNLSCSGANDGIITATGSGGSGSITYLWSAGGLQGTTLSNVGPGTYSVTATDINGCSAEGSFTLNEPPPILQQVSVTNENCDNPNSGSIESLVGTGGTGILQVRVLDADSGREISQGEFERLPAATYRILTSDANGCSADTSVTIASPRGAIATISPKAPNVELGESLTLNSPGDPETIYTWSSTDSTVCGDCPVLLLTPVENRYYYLTATSADGCTNRDTVLVTVDRNRNVYIPTAFSPNGDGTNDLLTVYYGKAVASILEFSIFDRWGGLFYQVEDAPEGLNELPGWDGTSNGIRAPTGVYTWFARVRYLDGVTTTERGSTALLR